MPIDQVKKDEGKPKATGSAEEDKRISFYFYKSDSLDSNPAKLV
jgi:hypothetical protein